MRPAKTFGCVLLVLGPLAMSANAGVPDYYYFSLDSMKIENTRARHNDTDHATLSIKVGDKLYDPTTKHLGDLNNGDYPLQMRFGPIEISDPKTPIVMHLVVVNAGHKSNDDVEKAVKTGIDKLIDELAKNNGSDNGNGNGWVMLAKTITSVLGGLLFADCDGVVVADQIVSTGGDLKKWDVVHSETRDYPGTDSPTGCGSNSKYKATWSIRHFADVVPQPGTGVPYRVQSAMSCYYLDVRGANHDDGGPITQANTPEQRWKLEDAGDGYFFIQSTISSLYLDVYAGNFTHGARVCQAHKNGTASQLWKLKKADIDGFFFVVPKGGVGKGNGGKDLCLDVRNCDQDFGAEICVATENWPQAWGFQK